MRFCLNITAFERVYHLLQKCCYCINCLLFLSFTYIIKIMVDALATSPKDTMINVVNMTAHHKF